MLRKLHALIIKELIAVWQDKRSRMALITPPIIQFFVFTFAATLDVHNVSLGILNRDEGQYSREFIYRLSGSPEFTQIIYFDSDQELKEAVDAEKVLAAIQIDANFSRKILSDETGEVLLIADGRKSNASQIAGGYISNIAQAYNAFLAKRKGMPLPLSELKPRNWYNANLNYTWFTITGLIGTLSMLTSLSVTALSISREKEMGTFEQLLVSPLDHRMILLGKAIPALMIGVVEGSVMLFAGFLFLDLPIRGSLLMFYPSMAIFVFAIVGIGLFISSLSQTQQQSALGVFLCVSPLVITSGFATPVENMTQGLQILATLNPLKYFLIIVRGICLKDISAATVFHNTWPMLLIALGTLGTASWFFKRKIG
ncbi:Inner membrane transport permease ybhR [Waddlia chondrophila 2032/99]|uniref:Transport permease protein n=1 Tax=Waddlia chondrophila 2032/99 TaxID=765953 RepID=F8LFA4_9BACT|nr:Inner membrane transport permease ybhR [Waddlia chondrophila 2032/99]